MAHDQGRRVELERLAEHLANADHRRVEAALVDAVDLDDVVLGVEEHSPELLLVEQAHTRHQEGRGVGRALDLVAPDRAQQLGDEGDHGLHVFRHGAGD